MTPGTLPITVYRNVPYVEAIRFVGFDFTGGTFALQVRALPGTAGSALIGLTNQTAGTQGLSVVVTEESSVDVSTLTIQIDESTIDALLPASTNGQKAGTDVVLYYDLIITATGLTKSRWLEGTFTIAEGVTV
jgi:hypothetical protein